MKTKVYSVRDNVAEVFNKPFQQVNDAAAIRSFTESVEQVKNIEEYDLYYLGTYDDSTGLHEDVQAKKIYTGFAVKAKQAGNLGE